MALKASIPTHLQVKNVAVLTLTYGDRIDLLRQMAQSVQREGVRRILTLANGLRSEVLLRLYELANELEKQGVQLDVYENNENVGSARGFGKLLKVAREDVSITAVWLMDDDNVPVSGALNSLNAVHAEYPAVALASVRVDRNYLVHAAKTGFAEPPTCGQAFHVDIFRKLRRGLVRLKIFSAPSRPLSPVPNVVPIMFAPYGGLFVPKARLLDVELPREDFVLYADDYEYTARLAASNGLYLVGQAMIEDLEASWNATGSAPLARRSQFNRLATMPPDFRLYYSVRNALYLDRQRAMGMSAMKFWINLTLFVAVGSVKALIIGNFSNAYAICLAAHDGVFGKLGPANRFPLPGSR